MYELIILPETRLLRDGLLKKTETGSGIAPDPVSV
jgi:hypothetical protein